MNIAGLEYNLNYKALEIYISGCKPPHCEGCHNKELWDFKEGLPYIEYVDIILKKIDTGMIKNIWLLGGEPLDQDVDELLDFVLKINREVEIWLWTRYEVIPDKLFNVLSYIKQGRYDNTLSGYQEKLFGITLASNNQKIIKV